ncbi:hypothetical protein CH75_18600 [Dyella jiangningensis]|jgi:hypothetical protein|uniref:hypothetical protein n=1 Tax=Dyella jiangningensis TaxID=1379159 RepID=UPI000456216E|nr:hypothetical protein [Dyella jiangningensis]AHX14986.1 hypothetical protein CH75_18600 [Dyella jiangningensis]MDG2538431.1 hypothetical protein [Dyella jiangningensis]
MNAIYSVSEREGRKWCVLRGHQLLHSKLCPAAAIILARQLARRDHDETGSAARVEFLGGLFPIVLANYSTE